MALVYFILVAANLIFGFLNKKNKIISFFSYFIIILLMSLNTKGPDVGNYLFDYNLNQNGQVIIAETGYNFIRYFFSNTLRLDFFAFHLFLSLFCIFLLRSTVSYMHANENCVIGLFMSYLFFIDTIQIRNFIIEAIFIYAVRFLFVNKKFSTLKYIGCILIAFLFHKIALVYLVLLIVKFKSLKPLIKVIFSISVIAFIFFAISRSTLKNLIIFVTQLFGLKSSYSFTETRYSFIPIVLLYFAELFVIVYFKRHIAKEKFDSKENSFLSCLINVQMLLVATLSLLLINMNFYRIIRNILFIKYIALAIYLNRLERNSALRIGLILFIVMSTLSWFVVDYVFINYFALINEPIFTGNLIFNNTINNKNYSVTFKLMFIIFFSILFTLNNNFSTHNKVVKVWQK